MRRREFFGGFGATFALPPGTGATGTECNFPPDSVAGVSPPSRAPIKNGACLTSPYSPVGGDCVVELVGLELTAKVLWNMVRVRPTPLVGHLSRLPGVC